MQVLQRYCVIALDEGAGGLVVEVAPLVADLAPLLGEGPPQPPAVARAGPGACLAALQVGDPLPGGVKEPRVSLDIS
jgi:hypothetical protein